MGLRRQPRLFGLDLSDKRVDPGYWLRSDFESPWGQLGVIFLGDHIILAMDASQERRYMCPVVDLGLPIHLSSLGFSCMQGDLINMTQAVDFVNCGNRCMFNSFLSSVL